MSLRILPLLPTIAAACMLLGQSVAADDGGKHLFILSGQSNMVGMKPEASFTPTVVKAFGNKRVIVVKDAASGQSIRSWCKSNHEFPPPTTGRVPKVRGELYDRLIGKVKTATKGQSLQTVTLVWMQGESDLNNTAYDAYLTELLGQLQTDIGFQEINIVIGRISDSGLDREKRLEGRLRMRRVQQEFAEAHPRGAWIDTDDLNDRIVDGKLIHDLHYTKEGYQTLGTRFAEQAIVLINKPTLENDPDEDRFAPGLIATFTDGTHTVSQVVRLPELGLNAGESPHPAVQPAFRATFEGVLVVTEPGTYRFHSDASLSINGSELTGEIPLQAGRHPLKLNYRRTPGKISLGLSWESDRFIREPVPPDALAHDRTTTPKASNLPGPHPAPPHRIAHAMTKMKCASCHDTGFLATMHHKFAPDALLLHMRHANPMKWYGAMTGPLLEESPMLTQLAADLQKLPGPTRQRGTPHGDLSKGLQMIGTRGGMACIACHDIKHHRTPAERKGPNLSYITNRVTYDWFVRWMSNPQRMQPGVPMPAFFAAQSPEQQKENIGALWDYLAQGDQMKLPKELKADPQQFVLKPTTASMVHRVYMRLPDGRELVRAICVGLPNGVSYCFDAETCHLAHVWLGGYLDMTPHWKNQSLHPIPIVGEPLLLPTVQEGLAFGNTPPRFRGYELVGGIPRFELTHRDTMIRLLIDAPSPHEIRQTFTIGKRTETVQFIGPPKDGLIAVTASQGTWNGNRLTIATGNETELVITLKRKAP